MKNEKISHLKADEMLKNDQKNRSEFKLSNGKGRIFSYHPYKSMQLMFIDVHSKGLPDFWELGYRKGDDGRYLRTLLCKRGSCDFTVNGVTSKLSAGQVMMDYGVGDSCDFTFDTEDFMGVEITMQVDTLIDESSIFKMLRLVIESMGLPEEEIYDSDGYIFSYSKTTDQAMVKMLNAAFEQKAGIVILAHTVEIGNSLGSDLKAKSDAEKSTREKKQIRIAEDIYKCLTEDYATKYTAAVFANKYFVSDTTVKKYFKNIYGYGFKEFQTKVRMEKAAEMLVNSEQKISDISLSVGYPSQTKFTKMFKKYYNLTPLKYRQSMRRRLQGQDDIKDVFR